MWTIRQEQAEAFRQNALQTFEDEMLEHLKANYGGSAFQRFRSR